MFRKLIGASVGLAMLGMAASQSHAVAILNQTFNNPAPTIADQFGSSVAIDGNNVVVGAHRGVASANESGQTYLFDNATGTLLQTFNDPPLTTEDAFGWSVAIDGNWTRAISKTRPSDGCGRDTVPLTVERWYDFHGFGCHLGNVGLDPQSGLFGHHRAQFEELSGECRNRSRSNEKS